MASVIEAWGLVKKYGDFLAVDSIDFSIEAGECFGFLGPNGAGKTSTLKMIGGVSPVSGGTLLVEARDVTQDTRAVKALLGVVPQRENLDPDLTVWQNLMVYARYFDMPRRLAREQAQQALELMGLQERRHSPIATLSDGMKRRLLIARALLNQPRVIVLDEPTTGLDPQAKRLVWQRLDYLKGQGATLLLSTHNMEEAAQLCDRLVIMHLGKIIARGQPPDLVAQYAGRGVLELHLSPGEKASVMTEVKDLEIAVAEVGDTLYLFHQDGDALKRQLRLDTGKVIQRPATLEDVFLQLTGRGLEG